MKSTLRTTTVRVLATLAVAVTSSGCAMKGDIRQLQDEMRVMAERQDSLLAELRLQTAQTQDTLRTQGDQMFDLRGDINRRLQQIEANLTRILAIAGQNQQGLTAVRDQLANMRRMPTGPTGGTQQTGSDSTAAGGSESLIGGGGNPQELYDVAKDQYDRGSINSAARAFQQFLDEHPNHELAPDAHYFLADILVQQGSPEEAIQAFSEIRERFPTHGRVPEALFRIAELQIDLEQLDEARTTLERIINTYPDSLLASLAAERLEEIG